MEPLPTACSTDSRQSGELNAFTVISDGIMGAFTEPTNEHHGGQSIGPAVGGQV